MKQVDKKYYNFGKYSHKGRWVSYFHQLDEVLKLSPESVLEVGVGDKVFGSYIKNNTLINYQSLDIAEDLSPDILGSVTSIPLADDKFDVVCAFEVLEHIPFGSFETALKEMGRVSKRYVVVSLPHFGPSIEFSIKIPFLPRIQKSFKIPYYKKHMFNGEHYWEIGKKGYPLKKICEIMTTHFNLEREFVPYENQYHHFFILEKK